MPELTLVQTLFGGVALVGLIHTGLGWLGLSGYWRAVAAALLPLALYTAWFLRTSPGGDVLSVHVAVYLVTAGLLAVISERRRLLVGRVHWAPQLIIGFFLLVFVSQAIFLVIASQGLPPWLARTLLPGQHEVHTAFSGVVPHSPAAAKTVSSHLNARSRQEALGWTAQLLGLERPVTGPTDLAVRVQERNGQPLNQAQVVVNLRRLAVAGPGLDLKLAAAGPGHYRNAAHFDAAGAWLLTVRVERAGQVFEQAHPVEIVAH